MSRSNMYAEVVDLTPVLAMMNEHADQGLPFIALQYTDDYLEWTQEGESTMPSFDEIEASNLDGVNALEPRRGDTSCQSQPRSSDSPSAPAVPACPSAHRTVVTSPWFPSPARKPTSRSTN